MAMHNKLTARYCNKPVWTRLYYVAMPNNKKTLKLRLALGLVLEEILLQKPVVQQKSKFLELFHFSNIVLLSLLTLFN